MNIRIWCLMVVGKLFNLAGIPPLVCECEKIGIGGIGISVRMTPLYTIISVDGYDLYFKRLTGKWDGTGSGDSSIFEHCNVNHDGLSEEETLGIAKGLEDVVAGRVKPFSEIQADCEKQFGPL